MGTIRREVIILTSTLTTQYIDTYEGAILDDMAGGGYADGLAESRLKLSCRLLLETAGIPELHRQIRALLGLLDDPALDVIAEAYTQYFVDYPEIDYREMDARAEGHAAAALAVLLLTDGITVPVVAFALDLPDELVAEIERGIIYPERPCTEYKSQRIAGVQEHIR